MPFAFRHLLRTALALVAAVFLAPSPAVASYLDDPQSFDLAVTALRSKIGEHARVFKIEIEPESIAIEAQDPANPTHIDRWRYGVMRIFRLPVNRMSGPDPVDPTLLNPDLDANLFDLADVDLSATMKLVQAAIARARLNDPAAVTRIEIQRRVFILPKPSSGDVRWTLHVDSGRERASVYANAKGQITGADLSSTQRARTLNIFKEPALVAEAAADFRRVGAGAVLSEVTIEPRMISFLTLIPDRTMGVLGSGLPSTEIYTWDLNGLQQRLGRMQVGLDAKARQAAAFGVDDVDWSVAARLPDAALAKAGLAKAAVTRVKVARSFEQPGPPVLIWTTEIAEPSGETTRVIANLKGDIQRVALPASRQPKLDWLDPRIIAAVVSRAAVTFGKEAKVASVVFQERGARITIGDPSTGRPATFDVSADEFKRSAISFSTESSGPRVSASEIAAFDEAKIASLQREAMKRLTSGKQAYMESVTIGAHPFAPRAGGQAIEVRLRDRAEDSAQARYAWIVFDFQGRPLNSSKF